MNKYGRSRKEQSRDRKDKHKEMERLVSDNAKEWFKAPAYAPRHTMPRYTVDEYLSSKGFDVKGVMSDGGDQGAERAQEELPETVFKA